MLGAIELISLGKGGGMRGHKKTGLTALAAGREARVAQIAGEIDALLQSGVGEDLGLSYWMDRCRAVFAWKPFAIWLDSDESLRGSVRRLLTQAQRRDTLEPGQSRRVLLHLVGATLDCALGRGHFQHHSFSTADAPNNRAGDFFLGDVAIHVTTAPGEAVIERCKGNLDDGHRPVVVTVQRSLSVAEGLAANVGLSDQIDIFEIEQFIALNLYELSKFGADGRKVAIVELVSRYNEVVDEFETDPSLKIELRK